MFFFLTLIWFWKYSKTTDMYLNVYFLCTNDENLILNIFHVDKSVAKFLVCENNCFCSA